MKAAIFNCPDVAQSLLDLGADKTLENSKGQTAYTLAVENDRPAIAEMLKDTG
jgi:ankyrin repeat protein